MWGVVTHFVSDNDAVEIDISNGGRYKPEGLDELCKNTNFSKKELQIMYRGFKQVTKPCGLRTWQAVDSVDE